MSSLSEDGMFSVLSMFIALHFLIQRTNLLFSLSFCDTFLTKINLLLTRKKRNQSKKKLKFLTWRNVHTFREHTHHTHTYMKSTDDTLYRFN